MTCCGACNDTRIVTGRQGMPTWCRDCVTEPVCFVFGSNLAGKHGKGAALTALIEYGAIRGRGEGRMGTSYALPTKDSDLRPLSLEQIAGHVARFLRHASKRPGLPFFVTRVGCGYARYTDDQIAPMFAGALANIILPLEWR